MSVFFCVLRSSFCDRACLLFVVSLSHDCVFRMIGVSDDLQSLGIASYRFLDVGFLRCVLLFITQ